MRIDQHVTRALVPLSLVMVAMAACRGDKPRYFHQVEGEAHVAGAIKDTGSLWPAHGDTGAATFGPDSRLPIHLDASGIRISATASGVNEPGMYDLEAVSVSQLEQETPDVPFQCIVACEPCEMRVLEVNDEVIAGELQCKGLRTCTEPTIPPDALQGSQCGNLTAHMLDVEAQFRLTGSSTKTKDY
jgi:hypothetical protein